MWGWRLVESYASTRHYTTQLLRPFSLDLFPVYLLNKTPTHTVCVCWGGGGVRACVRACVRVCVRVCVCVCVCERDHI